MDLVDVYVQFYQVKICMFHFNGYNPRIMHGSFLFFSSNQKIDYCSRRGFTLSYINLDWFMQSLRFYNIVYKFRLTHAVVAVLQYYVLV